MKRFFNSPQPLAFFGFLLTFLLTVAWRVPLQGGTHFFGVAEAATLPPVSTPEPVPMPEAVQAPLPIPQVLPAFAPVAQPTESADVGSLPNAPIAKKKGRHAHKKLATATPSSDENLAGLMSAAADGTTTKKRAHHE